MAGVFGRERMEVVQRGRLVRDEDVRIVDGLGRGVRAHVRADGRVRVWRVRENRNDMFVPVFRGRVTAHDDDVATLTGSCRLDRLGWCFTAAFLALAVLGLTISGPDRAVGVFLAVVSSGVLALCIGLDRRTYAECVEAIEAALPAVLVRSTANAVKVRKRKHRA